MSEMLLPFMNVPGASTCVWKIAVIKEFQLLFAGVAFCASDRFAC